MSNPIDLASKLLGQLARAASDLPWEWDDRFGAALTVIDNSQAVGLADAYGELMGDGWTVDNKSAASPEVSRLLMKLSGLREGQIVFARQVSDDRFIYVAFWPWGSDPKVSVRVGGSPADTGGSSVRVAFSLG